MRVDKKMQNIFNLQTSSKMTTNIHIYLSNIYKNSLPGFETYKESVTSSSIWWKITLYKLISLKKTLATDISYNTFLFRTIKQEAAPDFDQIY